MEKFANVFVSHKSTEILATESFRPKQEFSVSHFICHLKGAP